MESIFKPHKNFNNFELNERYFLFLINHPNIILNYLLTLDLLSRDVKPINICEINDSEIDLKNLKTAKDLDFFLQYCYMLIINYSPTSDWDLLSFHVWNRLLTIINLLMNDDCSIIKTILRKSKYSEKEIEKYIVFLKDYIHVLLSHKIETNINAETIRIAFDFLNIISQQKNIFVLNFSDIERKYISFVQTLLTRKIDNIGTGYIDVYSGSIFYEIVISTKHVDLLTKTQIKREIYEKYLESIKYLISKHFFEEAKKISNLIEEHDDDNKENLEYKELSQYIEENLENDYNNLRFKKIIKNDLLVEKLIPFLLLSILLTVIFLIVCLILWFNNPTCNILLVIFSVITIVLFVLMSYLNRKI